MREFESYTVPRSLVMTLILNPPWLDQWRVLGKDIYDGVHRLSQGREDDDPALVCGRRLLGGNSPEVMQEDLRGKYRECGGLGRSDKREFELQAEVHGHEVWLLMLFMNIPLQVEQILGLGKLRSSPAV